MNPLNAIFEALDAIFSDDDNCSDDVIKLKGLDFNTDQSEIDLHVETHTMETDFFTKIFMKGDVIYITGFSDPIIIEFNGDAEEAANSILSFISHQAEGEDDDHRHEEDEEYEG